MQDFNFFKALIYFFNTRTKKMQIFKYISNEYILVNIQKLRVEHAIIKNLNL